MNFFETKFTETLPFEYFDAFVNGIELKRSKENGEMCFSAFYDLMDSLHLVSQNISQST